jgi:transglutaminase-like putative cysteine protease
MLKTDWKQNLILLVFSVIMIEVLTSPTLIFVAAGMLMVFMNIKTTKLVRNILALAVFGSYWITYGKIIDPEVGLNFLVSIIVLKILEKETVRDRYMIFFGLLLLISAGSLFERTLTYVFFFSVSFLVLIRDFYSYLGQKWRLKDLGLAVLWVLPLTFSLFFFVPRLLNPIPFQNNSPTPGEIGYTPDVNISQIESLSANQTPVFQVISSRRIGQGELYWRGNTLSYNDGWNWPQMVQDKQEPTILLGAIPGPQEIKQTFRLFGRSDYFFALDMPRTVSYGKEFLGLGYTRTLAQRRWEGVQRYEAISLAASGLKDETPIPQYLQSPLSKVDKENIKLVFPGNTLSEVEASIRKYFRTSQFSYSLSPGKSQSFSEFMQKKIGFCSHYASAVAIILRVKGIPARLVSGYMGGNYNRYADFYLVSQNDAHVWVEAYSEGKWQRLDPTEWIAPDRVLLGGTAFMAAVKDGQFRKASSFRMPAFLLDLKLWFEQWDFHFYQWLEQMDYHTQEAWFSRFNFKREWLFSLLPLIMVSFMLLYYWYLSRRKNQERESEHQEVWQSFYKKMNKRGLKLSTQSLTESQNLIMTFNNPEVIKVWHELVEGSFGGKGLPQNIRKKIRKL